MQDEIIYGMSMEDYRAADAVSASDLKNLKRSPAYAQMRGKTSTPAQEWGTAVHTAILEPDELVKRYRKEPAQPEGDTREWRRTKDYREARAEILSDPAVEGILSEDDLANLAQIQANVAADPIGAKLHALPGHREASAFVWREDLNLRIKCRPDWLIPDAGMVVDVKTARDHLPGPFSRACAQYDYHISTALYLDALDAFGSYDHYVFLVVANDPPYEVASYTLDADSIEQGRFEYMELAKDWRNRIYTGEWPAGTGKIQELRLPEYRITYHQEISQ